MFARYSSNILRRGYLNWQIYQQISLTRIGQCGFSSQKIVDSRKVVKEAQQIHDQVEQQQDQKNHHHHHHDHHHHESETVSPQEKAAMEQAEDYEKALQFFAKGKYRISQEFFRRTLDNIKKSGEKGSSDHLLVLKKMVPNQINLKQYKQAENTLEEIIDILQSKSSNDSLIYKEYNNLFLHCLKYNLNKAIILGKALLSEGERDNIPPAYQKMFAFNLGTAYLLKSNFADAKKRLRECMMMDPNATLRGFALNNLAVACWWHKHPSFRDIEDEDDEGSSNGNLKQESSQSEYSEQQINADFENVIPLFKKAVQNIENIEQIKDISTRTNLQKLLDQDKIIPDDHAKFEQSVGNLFGKVESGVPLINIHEFLFHTKPQMRIEASFWFRSALKFYETVDPNNIDKCLIILGVFCSNYNDQSKAEGLFKQALEMIGQSDNYSKVLCLQMYGKMLLKNQSRYKEGEEMIAEAHQQAEILPFWFNKINYVSIPKLDLS